MERRGDDFADLAGRDRLAGPRLHDFQQHPLVDEPGSASLYFNDNAYTSNGKEMVYTNPSGISVLDLQTFKTSPVVDGKVRVIVAGFKTQNVYYIQNGALFATDVDTKMTRRIAAVPPRGNIARCGKRRDSR